MKKKLMKIKILVFIFVTFIFMEYAFANLAAPKKEVFSNGTTLIVQNIPSSPTISCSVFIKTGTFYENKNNQGINKLLFNILPLVKLSNNENIRDKLSTLGATLISSSDYDYAEVNVQFIKETSKQVAQYLNELLYSAKIQNKDLQNAKKSLLEEIKKDNESLISSAYNIFLSSFYENHPYSLKDIGTEESLNHLTLNDLQNYYLKLFNSNNLLIVFAGNINLKQAKSIAKEIIKNAKTEKIKNINYPEITLLENKQEFKQIRNDNSYLALGFIAPKAADKDYAAIKVIDAMLSAGNYSHLLKNLRAKLNLTFQIGSFYPTHKYPSHLVIYSVNSFYKLEEVRDGILWEISKIKNGQFSNTELNNIKQYLVSNYLLELEDINKLAFYLGLFEITEAGYDFTFKYPVEIKKLTKKELTLAAKKYLNHFVQSVVGPQTIN